MSIWLSVSVLRLLLQSRTGVHVALVWMQSLVTEAKRDLCPALTCSQSAPARTPGLQLERFDSTGAVLGMASVARVF